MYISTEIGSFRLFYSTKEIVKMLYEAGFDAFDFSADVEPSKLIYQDNYLALAKELKEHIDNVGIVCNQSHAPAPSWLKGEDEENAKTFELIKRTIEVTGILGGKICIVHPNNYANAEENKEFYERLEPFARKAGVKIALENMWDWKHGKPTACAAACSNEIDFKNHLDLLPKDVFVACVDIGHAEMAGLNTSAKTMLTYLGDRVQAIHLHDNDLLGDYHVIPFDMKIDYNEVIDALKSINYTGDITLEACGFPPKFPAELYPSVMKFMADIANYFRKKLSK